MPQVTVYIREDDLDKWKALQRKSEFIHKALNGLSSNGRTSGFEPDNLGSSPSEPAIPGLVKSENIKQNPDGTLSPKVIGKPSSFETEAIKTPAESKKKLYPEIIKTPDQAKKVVEKTPQFISKKYSARKPGSKERHVEL